MNEETWKFINKPGDRLLVEHFVDDKLVFSGEGHIDSAFADHYRSAGLLKDKPPSTPTNVWD